jgi:uncharacterized protein (TIGR03643 family)
MMLNDDDTNRLIEMAWQDRTPFEMIEREFGLSENAVKKLMRTLMKPSSFRRWRRRVQGRRTKHAGRLEHTPTRFQGPW